jgi:crotonobetainyl-CoA:carnitine CoA-transferase CaiB-like acyl-CoA transferase
MRPPHELLAGIRIVDLSWVGAGPFGTQLLAFLGADVVKIESAQRPDLFRRTTKPGDSGFDASTRFNSVNLNKQSIRLSLSSERGKDILRRLVAVSQVVVENFRPGVLDRLGVGYAALRQVNPRLVMASLSAAGQTGPDAASPGYASIFNAMGGLGAETGYPDGPPVEVRDSVDFRVGAATALGVVAALVHCARTGSGQWIDVSARETVATLIGESFVELALSGTGLGRQGNRREGFAPHDAYPCRGADAWVAIAVPDDAAWQRMCDAMGRAELAADSRFADRNARQQNIAALDRAVATWTRQRSPADIARVLNSHRVAASVVNGVDELLADEHLRERGLFRVVEHGVLGSQQVIGPPWRADDGVHVPLRAAPMLGEHTREVLSRWLGMPEAEIDDLVRDQVLD